MQKEAKARIKINTLLQDAGWRFFDGENSKANIILENHIKITQKAIDALGNNFEQTKNGFIDFLPLDEKGYPLVVLEAKSEDKSPLDGKEQARKYAKTQNVQFILLSNGNLHYFWDLERGNPTVITALPTPNSLQSLGSGKPSPAKLAEEIVGSDYIALTQRHTCADDPRWKDESTRDTFIVDEGLKFLRSYQVRAVETKLYLEDFSSIDARKDHDSRSMFNDIKKTKRGNSRKKPDV
ncbi:MAG TPA: type I restriction endonuclease [Ktedonobacteraceae bacterium]|jgi:type I restriction enzyme R subunit